MSTCKRTQDFFGWGEGSQTKTFKTQYKTEYFKNPYHGYQSDTCANILETKEKLGFQPYWSLEKGILDYSKEILSIHEKYFKK